MKNSNRQESQCKKKKCLVKLMKGFMADSYEGEKKTDIILLSTEKRKHPVSDFQKSNIGKPFAPPPPPTFPVHYCLGLLFITLRVMDCLKGLMNNC